MKHRTYRIGSEASLTRKRLLDAAERIMMKNGYAAVSSRTLARQVAVRNTLVHYYFPSMDELFLALLKDRHEQYAKRLQVAAESTDPVRGLWRLSVNPTIAASGAEFLALARHRKGIRRELTRLTKRRRALQTLAICRALKPVSYASGAFPPPVIAFAIESLGRALASENFSGLAAGHRLARDAMEHFLSHLQKHPQSERKVVGSRTGNEIVE